jgi:hypothetical protein
MYKISTDNIGDVKKYVWHYRKDDKEHGPFTYEDITDMVKKGDIGPEDYVLKFGNRKFVKASEVQGLFDAVPQPVENDKAETTVHQEPPAEIKEEAKEESHIVFENRSNHVQARYKKESSNNKIIMIIAAVLGLCLAAWVLTRLM